MDLPDEGGRLGAAADRPAAGQHVRRWLDEEDQRPVERQAVNHGVERPAEELVEIEGRAEARRELVERDELGEAALELRA